MTLPLVTPAPPPGMTAMRATGLALLAALAWGSGNVAQKTILLDLDPLLASGVTALIGGAILVPFALREAGDPALPPARGSGLLLVTVGLAFTLAATTLQVGYGLTTVTNAGFLVNTAAVLTPILAWMWLRERPAAAIWPASLLTLLGVFLMARAPWAGLAPGDALTLLAALCFAIWTLLVGAYVTRFRRPILMTAVQLWLCGALSTALGLLMAGLPTQTALRLALPEILYLGIVSKGLAYVLMAIAQQKVSASCAGVLVSAEAVFGAMAAALILGETLGLLQGAGCAVIILGIVIAARLPAAVPATRSRRVRA